MNAQKYDQENSSVTFCHLNSDSFFLFNFETQTHSIDHVKDNSYSHLVSNILEDECQI